MKKLKIPHVARSKRYLVIGSALVVFVASCLLWLQGDWNRYAAEQEEVVERTRLAAQTVLESEELSLEQLSSAEAVLRDTAERSCDLSWRQGWRRYISDEPDERRETCESLRDGSKNAAQAVAALITRLEGERELAQVVTETTEALSELKLQQYDEAIQAWQRAASQLKSLELDGSLQEQAERLVGRVNGIVEAYGNLKEADAGKSRPRYDDAYIDLQNAYQEFTDTSDQVSESYRLLAEDAVAALEQL